MLARGLIVAAAAAAAAASMTAAAVATPVQASATSPPAPISAAASAGAGTGDSLASPLVGATPACAAPGPGQASCLALIDSSVHWSGTSWTVGAAAPSAEPRTAPPATAAASPTLTAPAPFMAADLQSAYKLPSKLLGSRETIALVDAYDDPDAAWDVAQYRAANDLPACDQASGCFEKVNQEGQQGDYPTPDSDWATEESLDVDMASAICPNCHIILVEANSDSIADLGAAVDEAARLGANVISNSYGAAEFYGEPSYCQSYNHPGIAITASAGDSGFSANFPAVCSTVTAVGGTSLYPDTSKRGWGETIWSGDWETATGGGCSAYIAKPAWQQDTLCGTRTDADVSAVADPNTPVAIYDTYGNFGWEAVGGTSVASPLIAGVYALAGNAASIGRGASWIYAHHQDLNDVTSGYEGASGSNGDCGGSYLCTAGPGYDAPTGWGTPDGIGAF
jgi:hypothetical protein